MITPRFAISTILLVAIASAWFAIDLATKTWAFDLVGLPGPGERPPYWLVQDICGIQTSLNEGALFGMGQGQVHFFAVMAVVAMAGIAAWFAHSAWRSFFLTSVLGVIIAGILGNLWDRFGWHGILLMGGETHEPVYAVRDWILVMIGSYHWPNFNIADSCLVCGAIALVIYTVLFSEPALTKTTLPELPQSDT